MQQILWVARIKLTVVPPPPMREPMRKESKTHPQVSGIYEEQWVQPWLFILSELSLNLLVLPVTNSLWGGNAHKYISVSDIYFTKQVKSVLKSMGILFLNLKLNIIYYIVYWTGQLCIKYLHYQKSHFGSLSAAWRVYLKNKNIDNKGERTCAGFPNESQKLEDQFPSL